MSKKRKALTKRQKNRRKLIVFIVEIIILLILLGGFWFATKLNKIRHTTVEKVDKNENMAKETTEKLEKYTNLALLGLDNRVVGNYKTGNADSIIIASINNETKEVKLVSVYRDTYLRVTEAGTYSKVNSAYSRNGGAVGMMNTLNTNLDLDIEDYISVDWYALVKTINLIDGIDVEMTPQEALQVNKYVRDVGPATGYTTNKVAVAGANHLDGVQALSYARIRKGVGDDFKRTERQREVISKMVDKIKRAGFGTLNKIMDEVFPDIETSLSLTEMLDMAKSLMEYSMGDSMGFPKEREGKTVGSAGSCVIPASLQTNAEILHQFLFENEAYQPSPTVQEISNSIVYTTGVAAHPEESTTQEQGTEGTTGTTGQGTVQQ
ncbi:MAG: LytR family transcriptional regulator [Lachnospiraceae bacterium]|jgi:LCP family protein required for cell wall assembly|nr:LytR family transcriptional regulator [Lachnospiraceae bacterium]